MRCTGKEDEEGREREGEKKRERETEGYKIVGKGEGARNKSRKDDVAKWNKSKPTTKERQRKESSEAKWGETAFMQDRGDVGSHLS